MINLSSSLGSRHLKIKTKQSLESLKSEFVRETALREQSVTRFYMVLAWRTVFVSRIHYKDNNLLVHWFLV